MACKGLKKNGRKVTCWCMQAGSMQEHWLVKPSARESKWPLGLVGRACDDATVTKLVRCAALCLREWANIGATTGLEFTLRVGFNSSLH